MTGDGSGRFEWDSQRLSKQEGELAYFQIVDRRTDSSIAVDQIVLSDSKEPPAVVGPPNGRVIAMLRENSPASYDELAQAYGRLFQQALEDSSGDLEAEWLSAELTLGRSAEEILDEAEDEIADELRSLRRERQELLANVPPSAYGLLTLEDHAEDLPVFVRGDHTNHGEVAPRAFLTALGGGEPFREGSGRLELAEAVATPSNPLTARVMVNRIWKHHFGEGLVRTVDNFGATGQPPTHPELLDTLAAMFVESGWSVKQVHRWIVSSSAYRVSSQASAAALKADGDNRLLQHMPVRRLEAEAVRDALLAVTGTLNRAAYGPPCASSHQSLSGWPRQAVVGAAGRRRSPQRLHRSPPQLHHALVASV